MKRPILHRIAVTTFCIAALCGTPVLADDAADKALVALQQRQLDTLRREVETLKRIRAEKADQLEKLETARWQERYRQSRATQDYQDESRSLEGRYSKAASDLGRISDEVAQARTQTTDAQDKAKQDKSSVDNLHQQILQGIDKARTDLANDFPVGLEERTFSLSGATSTLEKGGNVAPKALQLFYDARSHRLSQTIDQEFANRNSQIDTRTDVPVYRLRLGTIYLAEEERAAPGQTQMLLRTGVLQGKVFEWRADLAKTLDESVRKSIHSAQKGEKQMWISLDLLQTKAIKNTTSANQDKGWKKAALDWFKAGGLVMYPLFLVAILGLIMALERAFVFWRRGTIKRAFLDKLHQHISKKEWSAARELCAQQRTCLGNVLHAVVNQAEHDRGAAEKSLREALLREQPVLETRMGLIAAMGSVAPLLGLLGTVTGMISLFKVITDVGTNDARILAGGISEALITTETGLIIAIPILLLHGKLTENLDYITGELNIQSMSLLNRIWPEGKQENA